MPYQKYSHDIDTNQLPQEYVLQRAENSEFIKAWIVYRNIVEPK